MQVTCTRIDNEKSKKFIDYVIAENLIRRHLNGAARAEVGLKILDIEEKKARKRQEATQSNKGMKIGFNKVVRSERTTLKSSQKMSLDDEKKGKSIKIVAKKIGISDNTLRTAKKKSKTNMYGYHAQRNI